MCSLVVCPSSHPFAFNNGDHCCNSTYEVDDLTISSRCDGERLSVETTSTSLISCCLDYVACEAGPKACSDHDPNPQGMFLNIPVQLGKLTHDQWQWSTRIFQLILESLVKEVLFEIFLNYF